MPKKEIAICERLKKFREFIGLSLSEFALLAGIKPSAYLGYEYKRSQLNYPAAWKILNQWPWLNPRWLAGDARLMLDLHFVEYPNPSELKYGPRAPFSEVYEDILKEELISGRAAFMLNPEIPFPHFRLTPNAAGRFVGKERMDMVMLNCLADLPATCVNDFLNELLDSIGKLKMKYSIEEESPSGVSMLQEMLRLQAKKAVGSVVATENFQNNLTNRQTSGNIGGVKSLWQSLKRRLQSATNEAGKKSELANYLKVDLSLVSRWLGETKHAREPGAEYTLKMLHWVEQQERQK